MEFLKKTAVFFRIKRVLVLGIQKRKNNFRTDFRKGGKIDIVADAGVNQRRFQRIGGLPDFLLNRILDIQHQPVEFVLYPGIIFLRLIPETAVKFFQILGNTGGAVLFRGVCQDAHDFFHIFCFSVHIGESADGFLLFVHCAAHTERIQLHKGYPSFVNMLRRERTAVCSLTL